MTKQRGVVKAGENVGNDSNGPHTLVALPHSFGRI